MKQHVWLAGLLLASGITSCTATMITGNAAGDPASVTQGQYTVSLTPSTVEHLSNAYGHDDYYDDYHDMSILTDKYKNWNFKSDGKDGTGTFNVLQYSAWIAGGLGGANFSVVYDDGVAAPADNYEWIQIEYYHNWGNMGSGEAVDSQFGNFPFYGFVTPYNLPTATTNNFRRPVAGSGNIWLQGAPKYPRTKIQDPAAAGNVPGGDLLFRDQPYCSLTCADKDGEAYIYFDLYLVTFDWNQQLGAQAAGTVNILDGMRWGVEITKAGTTIDNPGYLYPRIESNGPEPSTWLMLAGGIILLGLRSRRA